MEQVKPSLAIWRARWWACRSGGRLWKGAAPRGGGTAAGRGAVGGGRPLGVSLGEVGGPGVLVDGAVAQDVPDGGQDGGGDGADRLFRAAALAQALELRPEIAVLLARCRPGALHEGGLQPGRALAQPRGAALARALVVAGT